MTQIIGRVLRSSTMGFAGAIRLPEPDLPTFGMFCRADVQRGQAQVYGLIYNISVDDDMFARQVATAEGLTPAHIADQQRNRQVPVEYSVLAVGYRNGDGTHHTLPPQPPMPLDPIHACAPDEIRAFSTGFGYFHLILNTAEVPGDELLAAALKRAAGVQPEHERAEFLRDCGRELARLLSRDLYRLENLLKRIKP